MPDLGNGDYKNPVLFADYSDPDVIRVGNDFWLTSSSFNHVPGLPIVHSRDLVNWRIVNHALPLLVPPENFSVPRHGAGVWAPSLRYHGGKFWIYYPDPDFGIYVITADDPAGHWSAPVLVRAGKGLIDPCPLWDDDGNLYLVHAWARSRAGKNNLLTLVQLSPDGMRAPEGGQTIVDGNQIAGMRTLEGPKFYKRNGWYYIFAPIGGVTDGVQAVFRARTITGPYEYRVVLEQGSTAVNGPHQGALVDTPGGQWWFLHFQDKGPYGRIVHLQPVRWRDDWPVIGHDRGSAAGEPLAVGRKPAVQTKTNVEAPQTSDEFTGSSLGLQWQWQAAPNPFWASLIERPGWLRLRAVPAVASNTLYLQPNLLLQKSPAPSFVVTTALDFSTAGDGDQAGLIVFGEAYAWIGLRRMGDHFVVARTANRSASKQGTEHEWQAAAPGAKVILRVSVDGEAKCSFAYSFDGKKFLTLGDDFTAVPGRWVGAKVGLFAGAQPFASVAPPTYADFDFFRVTED